MVHHGGLQQAHAGLPRKQVLRREQHDHRRAGADDDGVNQHAERLQQADLRRMIGLGGSGGAGRGAGAGLVGEQAALDAVHQHRAKAAGSHLPQAERLGKDAPEDVGQQRCIFENEEDGEEEVRTGHDGY